MKQESMPDQLPKRPEIGEARPRAQTSRSKYSFFSKRRDHGPQDSSKASSKVDVSNISSGYFGGALQLQKNCSIIPEQPEQQEQLVEE